MYAPEPTGFSPIVTDLAGYLAENNWDVTVITSFPQAPHWRVYPAYRGRRYQRERLNSVDVRRGWIYVPRNPQLGSMKAWRRVLFDSTFAVTAFVLTLGLPRPDMVVAVSPPLQTALPALALKARWRSPTFLWVQDIVPDAAVGAGMMAPGKWLRLARWLEQFVYRRVDEIGVIAPGFVDNLGQKGVPDSKVVQVPNWADLSRFSSPVDGEPTRRQLGYGNDDFLLIHAGSVAGKQCLENAVRAVALIEPARKVHLLVVGDGSRLAAIKHEVERLGTLRVRFVPPVTGPPFVELLRAADALLLNQCRDVTDMLIPSKLLSYLPSGKPVIAAVNASSEAARFLEQAGSAVIVEPDDPDALVRGIVRLQDDAHLRHRLGDSGTEFVAGFDRRILLPYFLDVVNKLASSKA
jgi:colanic acid biosynthesis glycosyl transferase WcaI